MKDTERNQYDVTFENAEKAEKIIIKFLFNSSNIVRLAYSPMKEYDYKGKLIKSYDNKNPEFTKFLKKLGSDFIKEITKKNERTVYPKEGEDPSGYHFGYYYYKLSNKIKKMIDDRGRKMDIFYCCHDPAFFKNDELIGYEVSHEPVFVLFLTDSEKKMFDKQKVIFDYPQ